ncbi:unnamed protein product [Rotaria sp. Silwood2]|nr:unnamed protein product [Rotaria sp. Silwood2]
MPEVAERCLILSNDRSLLQRFCTLPDTLGMTIAQIMFLVDIKAFGNMFEDEVDPVQHEVVLGENCNETKMDFIGYMSGNSISRPKLFQHLRFAKQINLPKSDAQIAAAVMLSRRHGLSTEQIASICRYFSPGCCIRSRTLIKYFFRLWSPESPPFYRHVNQALSECNVEDAHLLPFVLYDYFEMFFW